MKKILALIGIFLLVVSCSPESDEPKVHFELLPIDTVVMPIEFNVNVENEIIVKFLRPTTCHGFNGFYYGKEDFTRTVAVESYVLEKNDCAALTNQILEQKLQFKPTEVGTYLFKFWKGRDAAGDNIFEEISVDVQ
ncbi:MAG: hypothetical protein V4666_00230 [Bacteroidota bacterium]